MVMQVKELSFGELMVIRNQAVDAAEQVARGSLVRNILLRLAMVVSVELMNRQLDRLY